jgi:uncharacterized protein (TIGR02001 family)
MKLSSLLAAVAVVASAGTALAADLPSTKGPVAVPEPVNPWDFDIGGGLTSNYIFRGITQSNGGPSVSAHGELRYNLDPTWQFYVGVSGESIKFSPSFYPAGSPEMELDGDAGVRGTFDKFSFDLGGIVYGYPDTPTGVHGWAQPTFGVGLVPTVIGLTPRNDTWGEVYFKPSYTVNDWITVGANFFYTPSYINTGASAEYLSGTVKATMPFNLSFSAEVGYQWFNNHVDSVYTNFATGFAVTPTYCFIGCGVGGYALGQLPDYLVWNLGFTYNWKFVSFDLRYWGTNLTSTAAYQLTGIPNNAFAGTTTSSYANNAIVGTISFDLTGKDIK